MAALVVSEFGAYLIGSKKTLLRGKAVKANLDLQRGGVFEIAVSIALGSPPRSHDAFSGGRIVSNDFKDGLINAASSASPMGKHEKSPTKQRAEAKAVEEDRYPEKHS